MKYTIEYINAYPEAISTIAKWHIGQWAHILPDFTIESYAGFLSSHYSKSGVPAMFVAVYGSKVIGTAAFEDYDMDTHPELSPWLASVYVVEKYRKKEIGRALVRHVIEETRSNRFKKLYLFTSDHVSFYERFGWKLLFKEEYYGEMESVMALDISPHVPSR